MLIVVALAALLASFEAQPRPMADMAKDFAIHFEFGLCWRDVVDTTTDQYVRDLANGETRTVRMRLTTAQRRQLADWVSEGRFFTMPGEIDASVEKDGVISVDFPSEIYLIEVRNSGVRHVVEFDDNGKATSGEVLRIRTLAERLKRFFTELPQVKRLPEPAVGCL